MSSWVLIAHGSAFFASLGGTVMAALVMFAVSKIIVLGLINYLQWNLNFVLDQNTEKK